MVVRGLLQITKEAPLTSITQVMEALLPRMEDADQIYICYIITSTQGIIIKLKNAGDCRSWVMGT